MSKYIYKFPGTQIEYLEGKRYDYQIVDDDGELEAGWALTPDDAELLRVKKDVPKKKVKE
jgi:hypothetical protein